MYLDILTIKKRFVFESLYMMYTVYRLKYRVFHLMWHIRIHCSRQFIYCIKYSYLII